MTVVTIGTHEGSLLEVTQESDLDSDEPNIKFRETKGLINSDLTIGTDVTKAVALQANVFICSLGVKLHGDGFIVTPTEAEHLGLGRRAGLDKHIRLYRNGRDLAAAPRGVMAIDLFGLTADDVRKRFPEVYQHVIATVKESKGKDGKPNGRDVNNRESYRLNWWIFGEPRRELRSAVAGLPRYIATPVTQKHRTFEFLSKDILPDDALMVVASDDAYDLGILFAKFHLVWARFTSASLGPTPRYIKSRVFDPFPYPMPPDALKSRVRAAAEELDALRKQVRAEQPGLTITQIYNVLEKFRAGVALSEDEEEIKDKGLVLIVKEHHDKIDALVAEAYGWPVDLSDDDILARLVALNAERAAEEKGSFVRWLRPDYQHQRSGIAEGAAQAPDEEQLEAPLVAAARVLASLARLGHVHTNDGRAFTLRRSA